MFLENVFWNKTGPWYRMFWFQSKTDRTPLEMILSYPKMCNDCLYRHLLTFMIVVVKNSFLHNRMFR